MDPSDDARFYSFPRKVVHLDPGAIEVIPGGVDDRFHPGVDPAPVRRELRLPGLYALTLATANARKNRAALGEPARRLAAEGIELVAAGGARRYMRAEPARPGLRELGYVPDELLPGLYAGARAFVLAAREEGFGLPCLEAMAAGTPVVAAASGGLPETCGDAALLVDPDDAAEIARALLRACQEDVERERLVAAGRRRAAAFGWDRAARATDDLLRRLAAAGG